MNMFTRKINSYFVCLFIIILGIIFICAYLPIWDYPDIIPRNKRFLLELNKDDTTFIINLFKILGIKLPNLTLFSNCYISNSLECWDLNNNHLYFRIIYGISLLLFSLIIFSIILLIVTGINRNFLSNNITYIQSAFLALSFPGTIYLLTIPSHETLYIFFAIFFIALFKHPFKYSILIFCYLIDDAETYVLLYFFLIERIFYFLKKYIISFYFLAGIFFLLIVYILNTDIIRFVGFLFETQKIDQISDIILSKGDYVHDTILLRILIPFKSFMIMTPYYFLAPFFTFFVLLTILIVFFKKISFKTFSNITFDKHLLFASLITIISVIFMLPTHTHGKYFIFIIPIIYKCLLNKLSFNSIMNLNILFLVFLVLDLVLFFGLFK